MVILKMSEGLIPAGFAATGEYREPTNADYAFVGADNGRVVFIIPKATYPQASGPRVILRKKPVLKSVVFEPYGEPQYHLTPGEWYVLPTGEVQQCAGTGPYPSGVRRLRPIPGSEVFE